MKTIKYAVAAIALSTLSFLALLPEPVSASRARPRQIGVVSARWRHHAGCGTGPKLAEKAAAAGAALITSPPP